MKRSTESHDQSLELCYLALASPIGIVVSVSAFVPVQQKLYAARKASGDPTLDCLQFRRSPIEPEGEIWIVKGNTNGQA